MPTGDVPGWHLIFTDGFNQPVPLGGYPSHHVCGGTVYPASKWCPYPDGWTDTSDNGTYMPSRVLSNHDGVLDLWLHTEGGVHMVSAPQPILPGASPPWRGFSAATRFASRPPRPCYKTAWLLWPDSGVWPRDGEIDFPEGGLTRVPIGGFIQLPERHQRHGPVRDAHGRHLHELAHGSNRVAPRVVAFRLDGPISGADSDASSQQTDALGAPDRDQLPAGRGDRWPRQDRLGSGLQADLISRQLACADYRRHSTGPARRTWAPSGRPSRSWTAREAWISFGRSTPVAVPISCSIETRSSVAGVLRTFIEEVAEFLQVAARIGQVRQAIQCLLVAFIGQGTQGFSI